MNCALRLINCMKPYASKKRFKEKINITIVIIEIPLAHLEIVQVWLW